MVVWTDSHVRGVDGLPRFPSDHLSGTMGRSDVPRRYAHTCQWIHLPRVLYRRFDKHGADSGRLHSYWSRCIGAGWATSRLRRVHVIDSNTAEYVGK